MSSLWQRITAPPDAGQEDGMASLRLDRTLDLLTALEALLILLDWGYFIGRSRWAQWGFRAVDGAVILCFAASLLMAVRHADSLRALRRYRGVGLGIGMWLLLVLATGATAVRSAALLIVVRQGIHMVRRGMRIDWVRIFIGHLERHPTRLLAFSFLGIILIGTFLLTLPLATEARSGASWIDALFTATSATCVTGLIVVDTPAYFSRFGEWVLLLLIQVGGIGIMTVSTAALIFSGRQLGSRSRRVMQDLMEETNLEGLPQTIVYIVRMTFLAELAGALLLFFCFLPDYGGISEAAFSAVFHAVSAFCNAGFSVFSDNLMGYRAHAGVNLAVAGLIISGGLGFTVVAQIFSRRRFQAGPGRQVHAMSVHTRMALQVTGILLVSGTVLTFFFEFDNAMLGLPLKEKLLGAFFQSVTFRTAGFNTISFEGLRPITLLAIVVFMFVGGSPGSTAGGIKTTTLAVLALSVKTMLTGRRDVEAYGRTIPQGVVYKATAIAVISFLLLWMLFALLLATQEAAFEDLLFEAVSAFGTVGLSTGVTPSLTVSGKLIVIVLMFIGRIGPLTLTLALGERVKRMPYRLPQGRIVVG